MGWSNPPESLSSRAYISLTSPKWCTTMNNVSRRRVVPAARTPGGGALKSFQKRRSHEAPELRERQNDRITRSNRQTQGPIVFSDCCVPDWKINPSYRRTELRRPPAFNRVNMKQTSAIMTYVQCWNAQSMEFVMFCRLPAE
ncbi:hypothetical protein CBL_09315 [Carabus blaptoides fortunei]